MVPGWLARLAAIGWRVLVTVALIVLIGAAALYLTTVTGSILVALVVTATVYPLVEQLRERGWSRARAAGVASLLALVAVLVTIVLIALAFVPYIADVLRALNAGIDTVTQRLTDLGAPEPVLRVVHVAADGLEAWSLSAISQLVAPIATFVTILILGGFLTFYLLEDGDHAWQTATSELDDWRVERLTGRGLVALEQVGGYLRGTTVTAAADSVSDFVYLTLLGVPLAGPLAVIVFIGGFVPYLGGIVTASILALVTLATQGWVAAAAILALIGLTNVLQARYLTPLVYGPVARIPIALAVFALPAGLALFGVAGLFITLPAIAVIYSFAPAIVESLGTIGHQASANPLVPLWLDRLGQWSWRLLVVFGLTWLLVTVAVAPFFSVPIVLAALMAPALSPIMAALRARGLGPTAAALAVTAATIAVIVVVMAITIYTVATQLPEIINQGAIGADKLGLGATAAGFVRGFGGGLIETSASLIASAAGVVFALVISVLLVFFFLRDGETWWSSLMTHVSTTRRSRVDQVGRQSAGILRGTMIGTAIVSFAGGVLQWFTMVILGLPLAFPIGVLMFLFGFVPYIGGLVATSLGFLVAVSVGSQADVVLMFIFTIVFNIVQGNVVQPLVYGKTVNIHPAVVLMAIPAGGAIGGLLGMVIVVPIISIIFHSWRTVLHLFDPEESQPVATTSVPAADAPPAARRPSTTPAAEGAEP